MRIAIIGSGISGLVAAYRLHKQHEITVFEANRYIGGHTNTVDVEIDGEQQAIDTGFIVHNDRTYPNFCRLLTELQVESDPTPMSFSVRCDRSGLEYNGSSLNGLFSQRHNLLRPRFHRMILDILRFNREAPEHLESLPENQTVEQYLTQHRYSQQFSRYYLLPMGSAIWSCPTSKFSHFPIRFIIEFYHNHGLLSLRDRPTWKVIRGGSRSYVEKLTAGFQNRIRLNTPVTAVKRHPDRIEVTSPDSNNERFDEVVFACHSDQALQILGDDTRPLEREVLSAIPYEPNTAILHTDRSVLPRRQRAWASWNYHIPPQQSEHATLTYNMNILQHIPSRHTFCVTLNEDSLIDESKVIRRFRYSHPVLTVERSRAQQRHSDMIRSQRTSFCGAYWGNGFHEDGVNSGLAVAKAFDSSSANLSAEPQYA